MFKLSKFLEELQARKAADKLKNFSQKKKEALDIVLSGGQQTFKRRTLEHFRVESEQVTIFYNSGDDGTPKLSGPKFGFFIAQFREMSKIVSDTFSGDKFFIKNT